MSLVMGPWSELKVAPLYEAPIPQITIGPWSRLMTVHTFPTRFLLTEDGWLSLETRNL